MNGGKERSGIRAHGRAPRFQGAFYPRYRKPVGADSFFVAGTISSRTKASRRRHAIRHLECTAAYVDDVRLPAARSR